MQPQYLPGFFVTLLVACLTPGSYTDSTSVPPSTNGISTSQTKVLDENSSLAIAVLSSTSSNMVESSTSQAPNTDDTRDVTSTTPPDMFDSSTSQASNTDDTRDITSTTLPDMAESSTSQTSNTDDTRDVTSTTPPNTDDSSTSQPTVDGGDPTDTDTGISSTVASPMDDSTVGRRDTPTSDTIGSRNSGEQGNVETLLTRIEDLKDERDNLTIAVAVIGALLALVLIAFLLYRVVLCFREKEENPNDIDYDMRRKARKSRNMYRPETFPGEPDATKGRVSNDYASLELSSFNNNQAQMMGTFLTGNDPQKQPDASLPDGDGSLNSEKNGGEKEDTASGGKKETEVVEMDSSSGGKKESELVEIDLNGQD